MSSVNSTKGYIKVHLVFVSKCRFKVFRNESTTSICKTAFHEVEENYGIHFEELNFADNHVHSLVLLPSDVSVEKAIQLLKGVSARRVFQNSPNLRLRYPRGNFWSGWYHYTSVGNNEEIVRKYIQNQQVHHRIPDAKQRKITDFFKRAG